jgi:hypothetical protein
MCLCFAKSPVDYRLRSCSACSLALLRQWQAGSACACIRALLLSPVAASHLSAFSVAAFAWAPGAQRYSARRASARVRRGRFRTVGRECWNLPTRPHQHVRHADIFGSQMPQEMWLLAAQLERWTILLPQRGQRFSILFSPLGCSLKLADACICMMCVSCPMRGRSTASVLIR